MRCGTVQKRDRFQRVCVLPCRHVLGGAWRELFCYVCELCGGDVFDPGWCERGGGVCKLSGRHVLGSVWYERVCKLHRGELLRHSWRELGGGVFELQRRVVLGDIWREQCEYMCFVSARDVFNHDGGERVHCMPEFRILRRRIHVHHKLYLQRRVLRDRRHVHDLSELVILCRGIHIYCELLMQRRILHHECDMYDLSISVIIFTGKSKYNVLWMSSRKNSWKYMPKRHCLGARTVLRWPVQRFTEVYTCVEFCGTRCFTCA